MSNCVMRSLGNDWLARELDSLNQEVEEWPRTMREAFDARVAEALSSRQITAFGGHQAVGGIAGQGGVAEPITAAFSYSPGIVERGSGRPEALDSWR